jgi:MSHA pilin protein MshD
MMPSPATQIDEPRWRRHCRAGGLSLIELLIFISVVSIGLAALLRVFVQATTASADPLLQRQALAAAESLLEEVQLMPFTFCDGDDPLVETAATVADCSNGADAPGPEPGENRFAPPPFDHVNDYHGYAMNGIVDITNTAVPGLAAYSASVTVAAAALNDITAASGDALRITVTVTGPGATRVSLDGYRSRHAPNASL